MLCFRTLAILELVKIVLTNDDGIEAPGFRALELACAGWSDAVAVAPDRCHSSMSHHITTGAVIAVDQISPARFRVTASPADCARLAKTYFAPDAEWLIAGINRGGNLGMDVCYSGTVAAAREAAILGIPAISISHFVARGREIDWDLASRQASRILRQLIQEGLNPGEFWNVNLPHTAEQAADPEIVRCELDPSPLPVAYIREAQGYRYAGAYSERQRIDGFDVAACFGGAISVTRIQARPGL